MPSLDEYYAANALVGARIHDGLRVQRKGIGWQSLDRVLKSFSKPIHTIPNFHPPLVGPATIPVLLIIKPQVSTQPYPPFGIFIRTARMHTTWMMKSHVACFIIRNQPLVLLSRQPSTLRNVVMRLLELLGVVRQDTGTRHIRIECADLFFRREMFRPAH